MYLSMYYPVKIQNGRQMCWLGLTCHRKGNIRHYYLYIAGLLRGQNQRVDQVRGPVK